MATPNVGKVAVSLVVSLTLSLTAALTALAQDAPPSIDFSFGSSSKPPSLGSAQTNTQTQSPPSLGSPASNSQSSKPPSLEYVPSSSNTPNPTPGSSSTPASTPASNPTSTPAATPTTTTKPVALESEAIQNARPVAPSRKTNLPKTGPELALVLIPTLAASRLYKIYRKRK